MRAIKFANHARWRFHRKADMRHIILLRQKVALHHVLDDFTLVLQDQRQDLVSKLQHRHKHVGRR